MTDADSAADEAAHIEDAPIPDEAAPEAGGADERRDEDDADEAPEALFEIEHEGRAYQVPRPLKDAFLRHADYTRKTQELAEQRRGLEQEAAAHSQAIRQDLEGYARLTAVNDQISAYERIDWNTLEAEDPARANTLWRQYSQLKDGRAQLLGELETRREAAAIEAQRETARRAEEGHAILARDIPGWSSELSNRLGALAQTEFGFTPDEVGTVVDPRMVRVLYFAQLGHQAQQQQAAARRAAASQSAAPIGKVGTNAPAGKNPDRMTTAEWMAFERNRLRRKA
jgi:hypothetical protein